MPVVNNRLTVTSIALFAGFAALLSAADAPRFVPGAAASYPTRQTVDKVTIAAVPFNNDELTRVPFGKVDPNKHSILPVLVVIQNDSGRALRLDSIKIQYVAPDRAKLEPILAKDLPYLSEVKLPGIENSPLPTGVPMRSRKNNPLADPQFDLRAFSAKMLPPGEKASGFFYFQTYDRRGATIYVSGIREANSGKELFYFEIPLSDGSTP